MGNIIAFDTETTGLNIYKGCRPFCISFTDFDMNDAYFRWDYDPLTREVHIDENTKNSVQSILADAGTTYLAHNAKFDLGMLASMGIHVSGEVWDTVVMAHVQNNARPSYKLKPLCKKLFGFPDKDEHDLKDSVKKARREGKKLGYMLSEDVAGDYALADYDLCEKYAVGDTQRCMLLYKYLLEKMGLNEMSTYAMEMKLMKVLIDMENKGICIDSDKAAELTGYYENIIDVGRSIKKDLGFETLNTRSPKQMHEVFYKKLNADPVYTMSKDKNGVRTKKLTANKKALTKWSKQLPLAKAIIDINIAEHELTSFVHPLSDLASHDGRVHPNYFQTGAITGRLSCRQPNLQNISNVKEGVKGRVNLRARELFVPAKDHVLYFPDYSQIEVWIAAFCSQDHVMMDALTSGLDMHDKFNRKFYSHKEDFEKNIGIWRKKVKTGVFCTLYGGGADALSETLDCTKQEAYEFLDLFKITYPELNQYGKDLMSVAAEHGWIENPFGRVYNIHEDIAYKSLNYMIQGSASEVMKRAMINVWKLLKFKPGCSMLLSIHDELCIEVHKDMHSTKLMKEIIKAMQGELHTYFGMPKAFPVSMAWTDTRWSDKKDIEI